MRCLWIMFVTAVCFLFLRTRFIIHYSSMDNVLFFIVNVRTLNIPFSFSFSNRHSLFIFHFHPRPQHGGSLQCSIILCGTFRRISQLWDNVHAFIYRLQYPNFLTWTVHSFWFYFLMRDSAHTLSTNSKQDVSKQSAVNTELFYFWVTFQNTLQAGSYLWWASVFSFVSFVSVVCMCTS